MKKILLIIGLLGIMAVAFLYQIRPDFDILDFGRSIILKKQNLPLKSMFIKSHNEKLIVNKGKDGFVLTGPYWTLPEGIWQVNLGIVPDCDNEVLGWMDVTKDKGMDQYTKKEIKAKNKGKKQIETLDFENLVGNNFEFRLYSQGQCGFELTNGSLIQKRLDTIDFIKRIARKIFR